MTKKINNLKSNNVKSKADSESKNCSNKLSTNNALATSIVDDVIHETQDGRFGGSCDDIMFESRR